MLYCAHCGESLPAAANFCSVCGTALERAERWEECEVVFEKTGQQGLLFPKDKGRFRGRVAGAEGFRPVASTKEFPLDCLNLLGPDAKNKRHRKVLDELEATLVSAGWSRCEQQGEYWYSRMYRRRIREGAAYGK